MKRIYDFSRSSSQSNYTIDDLKKLKFTNQKLSISYPANEKELRPSIESGIDLLVVWKNQIEKVIANNFPYPKTNISMHSGEKENF